MPTFNQLVRTVENLLKQNLILMLYREVSTLEKTPIEVDSPKRGVCTVVKTTTPKANSALGKLLE